MDVHASNWMSEAIRSENRQRELWERRRAYPSPQGPRGPQLLNVSLPPVAIVGSQHVYRDRIDVAAMPEAGRRNVTGDGLPLAWSAEPHSVTPKPGTYAPRQQRWNPVVEQGYIMNNAATAQSLPYAAAQPAQFVAGGAGLDGGVYVNPSVYYDASGNAVGAYPASGYAAAAAPPPVLTQPQYYYQQQDQGWDGADYGSAPVGYSNNANANYGPSSRVTRQVTRQVLAPAPDGVAAVPVVEREIVTRMVPHTVTSNQLVRVPGVEEVEEQYIEYAPIPRTRTVQRPVERVVERPVAHTVLVPQDTVEEHYGVQYRNVPARRVVEVTEAQDYDLVPVPVGAPHVVSQREYPPQYYAAGTGNPSNVSSQVAYHMYQDVNTATVIPCPAHCPPGARAAAVPYCTHDVTRDAASQQPVSACAGAAKHSMIGLVLRAVGSQRVRVVGVKPNSPAHRAGVCADDVLVAIGGVTVRDLQTVSAVIHNHCANYPVTRGCRPLALTLRRNGKLIHAAVVWW